MQETHESHKGNVITIYGSIGGIGRTAIAINLAAALARSGYSVALVDLDVRFGDVAFLLDLPDDPGIANFDPEEGELKRCLYTHETGVTVLPSPMRLKEGQKVTAAQAQRAAAILAATHEYLILDSPKSYPAISTGLDLADILLIVMTEDSVEYAKRDLEMLRSWGFPQERIKLILNATNEVTQLDRRTVERELGREIFASIPYNQNISRMELGTPLVVSHPDSEAAKAMVELAEQLVDLRRAERIPATSFPEGDADTSPPAAEPDPGPFRSFRFDELVQEAQKYVEVPLQQEGGEIRPAILALSEAVEANPTNFALVLVLGFFLKWSGEAGRAVSLLRRASELRPSDPRPYYLVADAYWTAALAGEVQFGSVKWFSNMLLEDQELRDEAPEAFVEVAESVAQMPREEEEYLNWISRRCREELGIDGPGAARTALELFDAAMRRATDPDNAMHVRQRMATVRAFSRSKGWN